MKSRPVRMCLGCGRKEFKEVLWRFVLDEKKIVVIDGTRALRGRGAYCCRNEDCLHRFLKNKKRLSRAFRTEFLGYDEELESIFGRK